MLFGTLGYSFRTVFGELQVLFEAWPERSRRVVSHRRHQHSFVCVAYAAGVDFSHRHKLGEGAEYRFYGGAAFDFQGASALALDSCYGPLVFFVVGGNGDSSFRQIVTQLKVDKKGFSLILIALPR